MHRDLSNMLSVLAHPFGRLPTHMTALPMLVSDHPIAFRFGAWSVAVLHAHIGFSYCFPLQLLFSCPHW